MKDHRDVVRYADTVELIRHELSTPVATALLYIGIAESCVSRLPGDVEQHIVRGLPGCFDAAEDFLAQ